MIIKSLKKFFKHYLFTANSQLAWERFVRNGLK